MIVGLMLKHYKVYDGTNYIPIDFKNNFVSFVGENGIGKSSILESLNSFFNNKNWNINKKAISQGISNTMNEPYIMPLFLIDKNDLKKNKKEFSELSDFFWKLENKDIHATSKNQFSYFFEEREKILDKKDTHYLFFLGESNNDKKKDLTFGNILNIKKFQEKFDLLNYNETDDKKEYFEKLNIFKSKYRKLLETIREHYSYLYIPVEIDFKEFTKLENQNMEKLFGKEIKEEILESLVNIDINSVNTKLKKFIDDIENTLENNYLYDKSTVSKKNLTEIDLVEKILEVYFQIRVLMKKGKNQKENKTIDELSAGEKRQAVIDLTYAFIKKEQKREKTLIIAIDEPESSLHTALCFEQFEKLKEISKNNQILITTHWYGFLPIISEGFAHFLRNEDDKILFESYNLFNIRDKIKKDIETNKNRIPHDYILKSNFDLVQSIFYSLRKETNYNWIICEGISEKIYFEYFFKDLIKENNLKLLSVGGQPKVSEIYEYLEVPIKFNKEKLEGKVFCLIDTDDKLHKTHIKEGFKNLKIRRLFNKNELSKTELKQLDSLDSNPTDIEASLNKEIFIETLNELGVDEKFKNKNEENFELCENTSKETFDNMKTHKYFKENEGNNKIIFAEKYIEILKGKKNPELFIPEWINSIKHFFQDK